METTPDRTMDPWSLSRCYHQSGISSSTYQKSSNPIPELLSPKITPNAHFLRISHSSLLKMQVQGNDETHTINGVSLRGKLKHTTLIIRLVFKENLLKWVNIYWVNIYWVNIYWSIIIQGGQRLISCKSDLVQRFTCKDSNVRISLLSTNSLGRSKYYIIFHFQCTIHIGSSLHLIAQWIKSGKESPSTDDSWWEG